MNPIDAVFQRLRSQQRKAFIPFVTAGDPDLKNTLALIRELGQRGASLIEVGFPYSDPIADGSVIQASYTRALQKGLRIDDIFGTALSLSATPPFHGGHVPLVAMVSYSLVHHRGPAKFVEQAEAAGFRGAIVPDLPAEESAELARLGVDRDFKLIQLVTPTTPRERAADIIKCCTGFLYCVSVVGITGERAALPATLIDQLRWLRTQTELPLCVGFGISTPEHVAMLREHADGIIVGSALVRRLEEIGPRPPNDVLREIGDLAESLSHALNP